ncbi:unnamed protein product [Ectocarpus sp. 4 AP-2014]
MLTPFTMPSSREQRFFNFMHSSMRMRVEHAFGRLKWKFLTLQRGLHFKLKDTPLIIDACCALYNFFLVHEGAWTSHQVVDDAQTRNSTGRSAGHVAGQTASTRDAETAYLASLSLERDWGSPGSLQDRQRVAREREFREQVS